MKTLFLSILVFFFFTSYSQRSSQFTEGEKSQLYGELQNPPRSIIEYLEKKKVSRLQEDRDREEAERQFKDDWYGVIYGGGKHRKKNRTKRKKKSKRKKHHRRSKRRSNKLKSKR